MIKLVVNQKPVELDLDPETPLLWVLRDHLGLTGTKFSCGAGLCGACTVLLNGQAIRSCQFPLGEAENGEVYTIEGIQGRIAQVLKKTWIEQEVPQCGYCQPGQIMTAMAMLSQNPNPSATELEQTMSGVLCRCGSYQGIREALQQVIMELNS